MSKFEKYWKELQRRHVVKAGLAYLVVAWLILQVLDLLLDAFQLGAGWMQIAIITLSVGFPIWLILAWVYDFSWGSIQKTEDVPFDAEVSRKKNVGLNRLIIGGLAIAVILLLVNTLYMRGQMDDLQNSYKDVLATNYASSIAVMAFDDLSPKKDQDYFARGLSQQIQQRLTKHKDLKVINTNSTFTYQGKDISIPVIGKELDVAYVLEGSVLKSGETFRVNLQLVSTKDGSNIWSKQFDQKLEDVLYTIDEIAGNVVQYLSLTFKYQDVRLRKVDPEAFDLYIRSVDLIGYFTDSTAVLADSLIRKSLKIDSTYSASWSTLSATTLHKGLYNGHYAVDEAIKLGTRAAKKALLLDPNSPKGHIWLSNWQWHARKTNESIKNLDKALELHPNESQILDYAVHQAIRTNRNLEATEIARKLILLDPENPDSYSYSIGAATMQENYEDALLYMNKYLEISKSKNYAWLAYIQAKHGDMESALENLEKESDLYWKQLYGALVLYEAGRNREADKLVDTFSKMPQNLIPQEGNVNFDLAVLSAARNDKDNAFTYLNKSWDFISIWVEFLFTTPEFRNLYDDPRWDAYLKRLGEEFNYDFTHGS